LLKPPVELPPVLRFGDFEADLRQKELRKRGVRLKLQIQPFEVLALLLERPGVLVTREEIQQKLWPGDTFTDFEHGLHNAVNRLREAMGDSAASPRFIETIPRRGYRFIEEIESSAGSVTDSVVPGAPLQGRVDAPARRHSRLLVYPALGLALFALALLLMGFRPKAMDSPAVPPIRSLVVLPLENLSGDPAQEYFADGMTDALIGELARIQSLRVISRTSAMHYKGSKKPLPEIARELRVEAVVEGSVLRQNDRVRVNLQLIHAPDDRHLWASQYDRDLKNVLELQTELARAVSQQVQAKLTPQEHGRLQVAQRPVNPQAYEAYLRGRYHWNRRNEESLRKSIEYYERALEIDPQYAPAYAGLADSYMTLGFGRMKSMRWDDARPRVKQAAAKAVELDPELAEAHAALGNILTYDWDFAAAAREFQHAIRLNPGSATAYYWYSIHLWELAERDGSCAMIRRAYELDPLNPNIGRNVASDCIYNEEGLEKALAFLDKVLELSPNQNNVIASRGDLYFRSGMHREAIREYQRAYEASGRNRQYLLGASASLAATGQMAEALRIIEESAKDPVAAELVPYYRARLHAALGRREDSLKALRAGLDTRCDCLRSLLWGPAFDFLRSDPAFHEILRRAGFPPDAIERQAARKRP